MYSKAIETLEVVLPKESVDILLAKIKFAIFLKDLGRHAECMNILRNAMDKLGIWPKCSFLESFIPHAFCSRREIIWSHSTHSHRLLDSDGLLHVRE